MILITKGGLSRGGDNEMPENCLYDCRLRDTCIYVPRWADEETLLRIGTERSKSCPLVQVYEVPKETEQAYTVMFDRKTEPTISKMEQVDEPQTCRTCRKWDVCPCGKSGHDKGTSIGYSIGECKDYKPQTNADQHAQRIGSVESVEPTWTKEEHEAFYTFLWNVINPNEMQDYIGMFETKDEPQTDCQ